MARPRAGPISDAPAFKAAALRGRGRPGRVRAGAVERASPWLVPFPLSSRFPRYRGGERGRADPARLRTRHRRRHAAARILLPHLERGQRIDAAALRVAMETAFDASDASGAWTWKSAYEACEAATVLFLRKFGKALFRKAGSPAASLPLLARIAALMPTHTRRSEEAQSFQQFSTPIPLGLVAATAAAITPADRVLEPSAGTGLLAILAEIACGTLVLNELAETRASLLSSLFPALCVTRLDAAQIDDHLDLAAVPTVVLMNPPFSVMANVETRMADAAFRDVASALARLAPSGRLVTITGANFTPDAPEWASTYARLQERGRVVFTAAIDGAVYAKHGTTFRTRLTVIDKQPADDPAAFPVSPGIAPDAATLMGWVEEHVPGRLPVDPTIAVPIAASPAPRTVRGYLARAAKAVPRETLAEPEGVDLNYETLDYAGTGHITDSIYEEYALRPLGRERTRHHHLAHRHHARDRCRRAVSDASFRPPGRRHPAANYRLAEGRARARCDRLDRSARHRRSRRRARILAASR